MNKSLKIIILIVCLGFLTTIPFLVNAKLIPCGTADTPECQLCHILILVRNIITFALKVITPLAILFIVIAGIIILTAGGSAEQTAKGKKAIYAAIIGIIIAFAGWVIINSIIVALINPNVFPAPWNAWKLECPIVKIDPSASTNTSYSVLNDADNNGEASPGDTLRYSFAYTNTSDTNLSNLIITSDYDQNHIFLITNISNEGTDDGDKITWQIGNLDSSQSVTVSYDFILASDFSDLLTMTDKSKLNAFTKILDRLSKFIARKALAKETQIIYLQNIIIISSNQAEAVTINNPIKVLVSVMAIGNPEDISGNPDYLVGYYEEPDDSSSKWSSYDWYFNQLANSGVNAIRLAFYNPKNPFYSVSPWINNNCAQPNDGFYTNWLKPTIDKANSKGLYAILTLYPEKTDWSCDNKTQTNRNKTYDKIINYLNLPKDKIIIEINWEQRIISNEWLQNQAKYFEDRGISTIITNWYYDDNYGAGNTVSTYAGRHREWNRTTSLKYFDSKKPTIWTERWFRTPGNSGQDPMTRFEARENIYRDALTVREPILFYYTRWSTPGEPNLPTEYLRDAGYAVNLAKKIPWKTMIPQERTGKTVGNTGYWAIKSGEVALGWINKKSQVEIDITGWNGEYNYWWFNPRNGEFNYIDTVSGNPTNNKFTVSTPDSSNDWVFVLKGEGVVAPPAHTECINASCQEVEGSGTDQCVTDADCAVVLPTHKECVGISCIEVEGLGTDQCAIDADCQIAQPISFTWSCNNVFFNNCYYVDRCNEKVLWIEYNQPAYNEYTYTFDSDSIGTHNCQVKITTGAFRYEEKRYQDNEKTDVYINDIYIGTSDDLYCNTGDGPNCRSCNHVVTLLSKNNINLNATNNEVKLVGHESHGLLELEINCSK